MSYQTGELYFIREREGGNFTPFVKIGLVRYADQRDSFNRLMEHQTGNPRKLWLDQAHIVKSEAIDMVEAQMHRIFAAKRVSGEWFQFDEDSELDTAIAEAKKLAAEAEERVRLFTEVAKLAKLHSTDEQLPANPELQAAAFNLAMAKEKSRRCAAALSALQEKLVFAYKAGADVSAVARSVTRTFKPKLDLEALKAAHPDLFAKYERAITKFRGAFLLKVKGADLIHSDVEFIAEIEAIEKLVAAEIPHSEIQLLNEPILELTRMKGLADWQVQVLEAELKVYMQTAEAIEGICTWKRNDLVTTEFDEGAFAEDHAELAKQFLIVVEPKSYITPAKKKAE